MDGLRDVLGNPIVQGGITGALAAAAVDFAAFRAWKAWRDVTAYSWGLATWRWFQGFVVGAVGAAGVGALLGA